MLWLDLETRSQCDLKTQGLARYAQDLTTQIICMSYAFDGDPIKTWFAEDNDDFPFDVRQYIEKTDKPLRAHNAAFERNIFDFVIANDYQLKPPRLERWQCTSAQAMAHGLPGALEQICWALELPIRKQKEGTRLIREYCAPNYKTVWAGNDKALMQSYCEMDVETMRMFSGCLRELTPEEWHQYHVTEIINDRGVPVDLRFVEAALLYDNDIKQDVSRQFTELTDGRVSKAGQRKERDKWLAEQLNEEQLNQITVTSKGVEKIKFDKSFRDDLAAREDLPAKVATFIDLVEQSGGATISKYKAMKNTHVDGRVHGSLIWNGAGATGRYSSRGLQLQNFKRDVFDDPDPIIDAIIHNAPVDKPAEALGRLVRSAITSKKGLTFSDYSQIEARVLPWLADDPSAEDTLGIFREGRDLYTENAVSMFGLNSVDEVSKDLRQSAKQGVLACLHPDSKVITSNGVKRLIDVQVTDKVFDGENFVNHTGVIYRGSRRLITVDGLRVTSDHKIKVGDGWIEAIKVSSNQKLKESAKAIGLESLRRLVRISGQQEASELSLFNALAGQNHIKSWITAYEAAGLHAAMCVQKNQAREQTRNTAISSKIKNIAAACYQEYQGVSTGAQTLNTGTMRITEVGASKFVRHGSKIVESFSHISSRLKDGITRLLILTGLITKEDTNQETSNSHHEPRTQTIEEKSQNYKNESTNLSAVYDIVNAGPNNCFTVLTDNGALVVHNCGFGGGAGAVQAMARGYGLNYSHEQADDIKNAWRDANPWAIRFWNGLKKAAKKAVRNPESVSTHARLSFFYDGHSWLWMMLPSGRCLAYYQPRFEMVQYPWGDEGLELTCLWGSGRPKVGEKWKRRTLNHLILSENATQATAADIMRETIVRAHAAGLPVLFSVHDELVVEGYYKDELHKIMTTPPAWSEGLPIEAETQVSKRYGK